MSKVGIIGIETSPGVADGSQPVGGVDCYDWYQDTEQFAGIYGTSATGAVSLAPSLTVRLDLVNNIVSEF
jgi:hypothetical protein